jgi:hypothetical protein
MRIPEPPEPVMYRPLRIHVKMAIPAAFWIMRLGIFLVTRLGDRGSLVVDCASSSSSNGTRYPSVENDLRMRAAFSHSRSRVAGQKASRWTRPLALAAEVFILDNEFEFATDIEVLERFDDQPNKPALEFEDLLSHEGRKAETRCMAGRLASPSPPSWPGGGTTERMGMQGALLLLVLAEMLVPERK